MKGVSKCNWSVKRVPISQAGPWLGLLFSPAPGQCLGVKFEGLLDDDNTYKHMKGPPPILYYMYDMETIPTWFKINHKVGGNTSVLTWIKLHKCPCKVHHVNKCYKQLYNLAQGHNTAISQENQNDPPMPLIWLQISNKLNHCFDQLST